MEPRLERVCVEGLVLLKVIKHYQDEAVSSQYPVHGVLLGLCRGNELEVTNCFPLPKTADDDPNANETLNAFETKMIKILRQLNVDYSNSRSSQCGWSCDHQQGQYR
ncbi:Eukaryotic translation initiation factor 3 subunit 3 gamma [Fasciola gigantica]|uniref:Eukaryotic translation initiation factor 3 subunit 3 gamma n=1 Tax=Fasciola gigantica TaxID=46835 RepID=A0A504Z989_FASGI|nr:Eukaryotic translation initiation factor 3 subunit 3 gamma [Fasciola gigantica]